MLPIFAGLIALFGAVPLFAQQNLTTIPDPNPELERRSFQVAEGFEVNLFAADPLIAKPIQMNFDPAGRLWLVSSELYPHIRPGEAAHDKVIVLEDRDGDGRADKTTVFADGLLIPTGVEPGDGGAYVANSTELLHLKDTNGDGRADRRRVVLSGFGTEDTHHILHTLRWGPDGMLYFNQSIYIHSHIETPYGVRRLGGGGIWQFRPETMRLDVFIRGLCNPWGHHFDRWGQSFATDGAGGEGINYVLPGGAYVFTPNAERILTGLNPGSPKYCGAEVLSGRHLPESWRGNILTNDFRGHRVCRFTISEDGAGYAAREQAELIKTEHVAFRPIDVKMGPDGAIYIADWYNPIIQHGEVDFRDPRRDHVHGRIWRVTAKGRPLVQRPYLVHAPTEALLDALKAPEDWTRQRAKRVLKERGPTVLPALASWLKRLDPADPEVEHHRLEALWTYQALDVVEPQLLARLLRAGDPRVRAAATRVVQHWHARLSDPLTLLAGLVFDAHPRVRLEAVRALAQIPATRSAELAMRALDRPVDRFLDYALWLTARELAPVWLPALQAHRFDFGGSVEHEVFALQAVGTPAVVGPLMELLRANKLPKPREQTVLMLVASLGGPEELGRIFDLALTEGLAGGPRRAGLLAALTGAAERRRVRPAGDLGRVGRFLDAKEGPLRVLAARAVGLWQVEPLRTRLERIAAATETEEPVRQAAFDGLALLGGPASREAFEKLSAPGHPWGLRKMAVVALGSLDVKAAASRAATLLEDNSAGSDPAGLIGSFLQRQGGPAALATALGARKLPAAAAKLGVRAVQASGRAEPALIAALTRAGGMAGGPQTLSAEQMAELVADVVRFGDPRRGEAVFRRNDLSCLKCHAIAGAGGQVGPDLASIGASAQLDYLIDSVLQPNKAIKENYNALVVATNDGRVVTGIKVRQTGTELVLRDAEGRDIAVPLSAIDEQAPGGSLMPAGLADLLSRGEFLDLIRFLAELGKVGPYAAGQARVVRRWQALEATSGALAVLRQSGLAAAAGAEPRFTWSPAYSRVSGTLPLDTVPPLSLGGAAARVGCVRCQIDVTTAGKLKLLLNSAVGVKLWVDGLAVAARDAVVLDLKSGIHTLTFAFDLARRRDDFRCELESLPGSGAQAQIVSGK